MGKPNYTKTFIDYSIFNTVNGDASYPSSNLAILKKTSKHFRSVDLTATEIVIDLGQNYTDIKVLIEDGNFATITFEESADGSTSSPILSGVDLIQDSVQGVYRKYYEITLTNERYLHIKIPNQVTTDGETFFRLGTVAIASTNVELDYSIEYPLTKEIPPHGGVQENQYAVGGSQAVRIGDRFPLYVSFTVSAPSAPHRYVAGVEARKLGDAFRDPTATILLNLNIDGEEDAFLGRVRNFISARVANPDTGSINFGTVQMEVYT